MLAKNISSVIDYGRKAKAGSVAMGISTFRMSPLLRRRVSRASVNSSFEVSGAGACAKAKGAAVKSPAAACLRVHFSFPDISHIVPLTLAMAEGFQSSLFHHRTRRVIASPRLPLMSRLFQKHLDARNHFFPLFLRTS